MISTNLESYYENVRTYIKGLFLFSRIRISSNKTIFFCPSENPHTTDPESVLPDGRYNHVIQIQERLNFMKYLLKEGALWLLEPQAESVWRCLAQNSIFDCDREYCFKWFSKLMHDDPDLEPDMIKKIFEDYITQLDPKLFTDSGIKFVLIFK
jgi:ubiquitin carboxyl-terminal hydrolase 9/24